MKAIHDSTETQNDGGLRQDSVRNLAVGHFYNGDFRGVCARNLARIRETFFAWPGVRSCRPDPEYTSDVRKRLLDDLAWARNHGIELDTLFNCNCYGDRAISAELADFVSSTLRNMDDAGLFPDTVTTTSPFVATILRQRFPSVRIRWSVNLRVHGTVGLESVLELFDSFYVTRERQRETSFLAATSRWARAHGKMLGLQANSGCLRQCPFQTFHDNLHGHDRRAQSKVGEAFDFSVFRCKTHYARGNFEDFLRATWLRPEDLPHYEPYVDVIKLATRRHPDPETVIDAYARRTFSGDLARLMDPAHTFPGSIENAALGAEPLWNAVRECPDANDCRHCGRCRALCEKVFARAP